MKKALSILLAIITLVSITVIPASAETDTAHNDIEVIVHNENLDEETKAKIVEFYTNPENEDDNISTYNLTCKLIGCKFEYSVVTKITHKARSSAPRCLEEKYYHGVCIRCGDSVSTLMNSSFIYCCA